MKTIQTVFKANMKASISMLLLFMIGVTSCSKDETTPTPAPVQQENLEPEPEPEPELVLSSDKQLTGFRFAGIENNGVTVDIPGQIDEEGKTIAMEMPNGTEITALEPELGIPDTAIYEPTGLQDFSSPINYTVIAEDGTSRTYLVTVDVLLSQKDILLLIAAANPNSNLDWNETDNLNDWEEVTLNGNGDIIELIGNLGLNILPPEIGLLRSLEVLRLANMSLSSLPPEIGQLISLEELSLFNCGLESVPTEIGQLTSLTKLNLSNNNLSSLPAEIGQLGRLINLDLRLTTLSSLPAEIGQLSSLENLNLDNNNLSSLPVEFGQLSSLESLSLWDNNLDKVPQEIPQLTSLESLVLGHNRLTSLPTEIKQLVNLKSLNVRNNNLSNLPTEITQLVNLKTLDISTNNLSKFNHVPYIPSGNTSNILSCSTETNLTTLILFGNPNLTTISECICNLDVANGGTVNIDVVPNQVDCVDSNVIGN